MAVSGVYYTDDQRCTVFLYRHFGAVSGQDVYGSEKAADISGERAVLRTMEWPLAVFRKLADLRE